MVEEKKIAKGFQHTEIGLYPIDWEVVDFGTLVIATQLGGNYPNNEIDNGVHLIKMGNLGRGNIVLKKIEFIPSSVTPNERDRLHYGDVIFNTRNTLELVGKVAVWRNELLNAYFNSNILRFGFNPEKIESSFYMNYVLNSRKSITQLKGIATGTTSVAAIYARDLLKIKIPLPPDKTEQTAIATALADMDALINRFEQLIIKKLNTKQGAMQILLKPKEGWDVVRLDALADIDHDNLSSSTDPNYNFRYISLEDVDNGVLTGSTEMSFGKAPSRARRKIKKDDVLISTVRPNLKSHLLFNLEEKDYICSTGFALVRCKKGHLSAGYLFNHLFAKYINQQIDTVIAGSNYPAISSKDVKALHIPIPKKFEEQENIALILSDMNADIEKLENQLLKYKMLRTGMLQVLFTGEKRLV